MTSNSSFAYPAEYYYPDFIDSRPDDPRKSSPSNLLLKTSINNGIGSSTKVPKNFQQINETTIKTKPITKKQPSTTLAFDVVTNQGLPNVDMIEATKTDPTKHLVRDPAEKNIPRLFVDENIIKQTVRTPRIITTNLDDGFDQINYGQKSFANGYMNGDLKYKTKSHELTNQQTVKFIEDEQPINDYWKKEVFINDDGVVTIEPLKYDRNTYNGPFGLTRQGSFIFYIGTGIFTILAAIFLILTGVFYAQDFPSESSNTVKLAGIGICAFVFYFGLLLILIGLWHQKYRQENPTQNIRKSNIHNDSSAHLKTSMEVNEPYNYSYQQQIDYPSYENYSNPPYISNTNEQMLLQQSGVETGTGFYEPITWPSNVEIETQPDAKFFQPMEFSYGPQSTNEKPSTPTSTSVTTTMNNNKSEKKRHHHHHKKKTVDADPPKHKFDNIIPNSTVIEPPLPELKKAPETSELLKSIADMEKSIQQSSTTSIVTQKNFNRIKPFDDGTGTSSLNGHQHHHNDHHHRHRSHGHHHHHHQRHHRHSYSSCSTCSDRSHSVFYSDLGYSHRHHHQHRQSEPVPKIITPRPRRTRTPSLPERNKVTYRNTGNGTGPETKVTKDSNVTADLEDVPNVRDNRLGQIPVVHRTIIVEPYPAQPNSEIVTKPNTDMTEKIALDKNQKLDGNNEAFVYPSTTFTKKKSKKKKKTIENNKNILQDLKLEDVNGTDDEHLNTKSKKKNTDKTLSKKSVKNAFYN